MRGITSMPQLLLAVPAIAGSFGVGVPAALTTTLGLISGGLGLAQGIAKKDPFAIATSVLPIGSGIASAVGSGAGAASSAANALDSAAKAASPLQGLANFGNSIGGGLLATPGNIAGRGSIGGANIVDKISNTVGGVASAASGIMSVLNSFKKPPEQPGARMLGLGGVDSNLPAVRSSPIANLPNVPSIESSGQIQRLPKYELDIPENDKYLKLLGAFTG